MKKNLTWYFVIEILIAIIALFFCIHYYIKDSYINAVMGLLLFLLSVRAIIINYGRNEQK